MKENEIFGKIIDILKELSLDVDIDKEINMETMLIGGGYLDSMDLMSYISHIEEKFNVKISDKDIADRKLGIVKNMVSFLIESEK